MKIWLLMAALFVILVGCSGEKNAETGSDSKGAERPLVYVANYPLKYFAERISTPLVDVRLPIPAGEDPAFWKPSSEDVLALQQADLVVLNGASYESWLKNVSLSPSKLVDTSANFKDRLIPLEGTTTHSHGLKGEHEHSGTAFTIWLDLTLAVEQARAIKDALVMRWPRHKDQFEAQFNKLAQELSVLDTGIKKIVAVNPGLPVVFSHPVYQYFRARYGIDGRSVHWEPDEMPDEAMWSEFMEQLKRHSAKWMIWEGKPLQSIVDKLQALGVNSAVVDPCGNVPDDGDFFNIMSQNVVSLRRVYQ
jgi:zinc transport system substrate-binding protein